MAGSSSDSRAVDSQPSSCAWSSMRNVLRAPEPASGFTTNGRPHSAANATTSAAVVARRWRAHGIGLLEDRLHRRLVPEVVSGLHAQARDAEALADLGQRHLQVLEDGQQPVDATKVLAEPSHAERQLLRIRQSSNRQCPANRSRTDSGKRSCGSVLMSPTRVSRTCTTAATKRVVASRAYGATKTTLAIGGAR